MTRIQNAVIGRGYVTTRVLAAPQDLKTGTLTLTLIPGHIRHIRFAEGSAPRAAIWNAVPSQPGDLLNLRDIEQALENFQRIPTVAADIQIVPADGDGARPGESDLVISWQQRGLLRTQLALDDSGSRSTGKIQASTTFSLDNFLRANELFYVSFGHSVFNGSGKQTLNWTAHYAMPWDYWLVGATVSGYDYEQTVVGFDSNYIYSGPSRNAELRASYLLYRDATKKVGFYGRGWWRQSRNFIDDTEVQVQRRRTAGWEAGLTHKQFFGAAVFDGSLAYRRGTGAFDALRSPEELAQANDPALPLEGTSRMQVVTASGQLSLPFKLAENAFRYSASGRAQWNRTPLAPQDRFAIGGRYTVRGFDGEASLIAERGWLLRQDLGWRLGAQELYVGADYGHISGPGAAAQASKDLIGAVIGVRGGWRGLSWDGFIGAPIDPPDRFGDTDITTGFSFSASF